MGCQVSSFTYSRQCHNEMGLLVPLPAAFPPQTNVLYPFAETGSTSQLYQVKGQGPYPCLQTYWAYGALPYIFIDQSGHCGWCDQISHKLLSLNRTFFRVRNLNWVNLEAKLNFSFLFLFLANVKSNPWPLWWQASTLFPRSCHSWGLNSATVMADKYMCTFIVLNHCFPIVHLNHADK